MTGACRMCRACRQVPPSRNAGTAGTPCRVPPAQGGYGGIFDVIARARGQVRHRRELVTSRSGDSHPPRPVTGSSIPAAPLDALTRTLASWGPHYAPSRGRRADGVTVEVGRALR
jgi:hypothetical protein